MDRFSRLEFGERDPEKKTSRGETVRDADYFHKEAVRYWLAGDYEVALRNYSRVLENNNTVFEAWSGQVLMLIELGEYPEACVWADKALELFPEHPELLALKAVACLRDAKVNKAIAYSDNSVSKNNLTPRVWLSRAEVFAERKGSIAENCVSKGVGIAGEQTAVVKLEAGRVLRRKGDYAAAITYLNEALRELPQSALVWYELGFCQAKLGRAEAEMTLEQCLRLRPDWNLASEALKNFKKRGFFRRLFGG